MVHYGDQVPFCFPRKVLRELEKWLRGPRGPGCDSQRTHVSLQLSVTIVSGHVKPSWSPRPQAHRYSYTQSKTFMNISFKKTLKSICLFVSALV